MSDKHLFAHDLTPQRKFLLTQTRDRIFRRTLRTSDLQLSLLHFREAKLGGWLSESVNPFSSARSGPRRSELIVDRELLMVLACAEPSKHFITSVHRLHRMKFALRRFSSF